MFAVEPSTSLPPLELLLRVNQVDVEPDDGDGLLGLLVLDDKADDGVPLGRKRKVPAAWHPANNIGDRVVGAGVAQINSHHCQRE